VQNTISQLRLLWAMNDTVKAFLQQNTQNRKIPKFFELKYKHLHIKAFQI